jgi:CPA1 family monovalent cation:H+ antiporter
MVERIRSDYQDHITGLLAQGADGEADRQAVRYEQQEHQLRLAVLDRKRQAVTDLRNGNHIDDYVLRDLQASMDIEEMRLLGPAPLD